MGEIVFEPHIDQDGNVYVDGLKICRATRDRKMIFLDKNKYRSAARGSEFAAVSLESFIAQLLKFYGINAPA